jgi:hypothetical protein
VNTYQVIFQQGYEFITASKMLELIIQRIQEFIFVLYTKDKVYSIIIMDDRYKDLFNNSMHITLQEFELSKEEDIIFTFPIYARLKFKQHYAIPFCLQAEPFPLYKVLADYAYSSSSNNNNNKDNNNNNNNNNTPPTTTTTIPLAFFMHAYQRNERSSIASYLRKHDMRRTSIYYAYGDHIRAKLQLTHYHATLLLASNSKQALMKGLSAFKASYFTYSINSNNHRHELLKKQRLYKHIFAKPKKPWFSNQRYTVLSHIELVSLMLPDSLMLRLAVDGIRPYTTGVML